MNWSFFRSSRVVPLIAVAVFLVGTAACGTPTPAQPTSAGAGTPGPQKPLQQLTVALDWYPWSNHTGLYMAEEMGYYKDVGLDVKLYVPSNPEDVLKLVGSGKDNFGISYEGDVLLARAENIPVKSVAAMVQRPLNSIMTLKSSGIEHPRQLEGKTVGYPGIPGQEAMLKTIMERDGSSIDKVKLVNVGYDLVPALIGKKVDAVLGAYWVHESILAEEQGYPVNIMKVGDWGVPNYYELVMVASEDMIKQQPDTIKRFLWATAKGYTKATEDPAKALDLLVKANPDTDRKMEEQGIKLLAPLWMDNVTAWGTQDKQKWENYGGWMKREKLLPDNVNPNDAFTPDLITK
ncbi:MAG TPA: ABC transporter substrate-binding protein [Chloroflexota bacterium]